MAQRPSASQRNAHLDVIDISEAVAIARLRMMIARSEARKAQWDFAEAIHRLESSAARALAQDTVLAPTNA